MIEINWRGIARVAKLMGGEGTNLLMLKAKTIPEPAVLDACLPDDDGESPANGGWFSTPRGPMLLIEGLAEDVNPWIEQLAQRLTSAGVDGTLTGGSTVNQTTITWAMDLENAGRRLPGRDPLPLLPHWCALVGYRSVPNWWESTSEWTCGDEALEAAVAHAMGWLTSTGGRVLANVDLQADFWVDTATATTIFASESQRYVGVVKAFNEEHGEIRTATAPGRNQISLDLRSSTATWQEMIADLRGGLLSAPLPWVSVAMIHKSDWSSLLYTTDTYYATSYGLYPNRWDEFTLDPCGIQILTSTHLEKANDLTDWHTTRLDDDHFLVEAKDLAAWYQRPLTWETTVSAELMDKARVDFGQMILTPALAEANDMVGNPRFKKTTESPDPDSTRSPEDAAESA